jgi:Ca2+-binding RTX toxin-like protein
MAPIPSSFLLFHKETNNMPYRLDFVKLTCNHAGADLINGDDTFLRFQGGGFNSDNAVNGNDINLDFVSFGGGFGTVLNTNPAHSGIAHQGHPMDSGDVGFLISDGSTKPTRFDGPLSVVVIDQDGQETADHIPPFIDFNNDLLGTATFTPKANDPLGGQFKVITDISGGGSSYQVEFQVTKVNVLLKPRHPNGKLAAKTDSILNGNDKAGTLIGLSGKDIIYANDGDDILFGGANDDTLFGGKDNDLLVGGKGDDLLTGNAGSDTFVVFSHNGLDTITDFHVKQDFVGLGNGLKFADLNIIKGVGGTLIKAGDEQLVLLQGVTPAQLSASNFIEMDSAYLNSVMHSTMTALKAG